MRKIKLSIKDEKSGKEISGIMNFFDINKLYQRFEINGVSQLLFQLNEELNEKLNEDIKISFPNELTILPEGKKW